MCGTVLAFQPFVSNERPAGGIGKIFERSFRDLGTGVW
jgi:hypothetical protein